MTAAQALRNPRVIVMRLLTKRAVRVSIRQEVRSRWGRRGAIYRRRGICDADASHDQDATEDRYTTRDAKQDDAHGCGQMGRGRRTTR